MIIHSKVKGGLSLRALLERCINPLGPKSGGIAGRKRTAAEQRQDKKSAAMSEDSV